MHLTVSSGHERNLLVLVCTDQPLNWICRTEVSCTQLDDHGSTIYQLVSLDKILFGCAQTKKSDQSHASNISLSVQGTSNRAARDIHSTLIGAFGVPFDGFTIIIV